MMEKMFNRDKKISYPLLILIVFFIKYNQKESFMQKKRTALDP